MVDAMNHNLRLIANHVDSISEAESNLDEME